MRIYELFGFADFSDCIPEDEFTWTEEDQKWLDYWNAIDAEYFEYLKQIGCDIPELREDDLPY